MLFGEIKKIAMEKKVGFVELTEARKGEIALILIKDEFTKNSHSLNRTDVMRKIGQASDKLKGIVTKEELISFYKELIEEAVKKLF